MAYSMRGSVADVARGFCGAFGGIRPSPIAAFRGNCPRLTVLDVDGCSRITGAGLCEVGRCCTLLTSLNLNGVSIRTDKHLLPLATGCPSLTALNLGYCDALTLRGVQTLAAGSSLVSIDLYSCAQVDDAWLAALAATSPRLTAVNLGYCDCITLVGISRLGEGCPELGSLGLAGCVQVCDEWLPTIVGSCARLRKLELAHTGVSRAGIEWLQAHHPGIV